MTVIDNGNRRRDEYWMLKALELAEKALDRDDFPVGCVLVMDNEIVGAGARIHTRSGDENELDHAEMVALRDWISRRGAAGLGDDAVVTVYCSLEPCLMCLGALILNGIKRIVYAYEDVMGGAAGIDFSNPITGCGKNTDPAGPGQQGCLYHDGCVDIVGGVLRDESLALFREYFLNTGQSYWKDSLLCRYTLDASCNH
ncbi:MAG TPA: nucleoside deaminase [Thermodesulfobacteriaceae bacterium]|nr:nucleoside deaminase [Thermodesulfobacteriaceae bacterium]